MYLTFWIGGKNIPLSFPREIVKLNDEKGVIEVIHGKAEDIDLPVQVDIIIRNSLMTSIYLERKLSVTIFIIL